MSFEEDLRRIAAKTGQRLDQVVRQAGVLAAQGVILKSPVGNAELWKQPRKGYVGGRFRANWNVSTKLPDTSTTGKTDAAGSATLQRLVAGAMQAKLGDVIWITNGLPYARRLEYGWSTQAPHGFVRITLADLPRQLEQYAKSLK